MDIEVEFEPLGDGSSVEVLIGDVDDYYLLKGTFTWAIWSGWAYDPEDEEITSDEIEWGLPLDEVVALLQNAVSEDADLRNDGALRNVIERGALETGEMAACIVLPIDEFLVEIAAELETPIPMDELAGRPKKSVLSSSGHRSPNKALEDPSYRAIRASSSNAVRPESTLRGALLLSAAFINGLLEVMELLRELGEETLWAEVVFHEGSPGMRFTAK